MERDQLSKILAITNQKGGVGKTTTSVNLAASLAATQRRVLLIDLDPQGNATVGCGISKAQLHHTIFEVLTDQAEVKDVILPVNSHLHVLPANGDLSAADMYLMDEIGREGKLLRALAAIREHYEYILIDCPPALGLLTINALAAADAVMIPIQCEYYALEGLAALLETIKKIQKVVNPKLEIDGLLRTMFDPRNSLSNDVSKQLLARFKDKVYRTVIPRNVRLAEAPSHGQPILTYDGKSRGAVAYLALAGELLRRAEQEKNLLAHADVPVLSTQN
jgi:chromosome partitioning protein